MKFAAFAYLMVYILLASTMGFVNANPYDTSLSDILDILLGLVFSIFAIASATILAWQ